MSIGFDVPRNYNTAPPQPPLVEADPRVDYLAGQLAVSVDQVQFTNGPIHVEVGFVQEDGQEARVHIPAPPGLVVQDPRSPNNDFYIKNNGQARTMPFGRAPRVVRQRQAAIRAQQNASRGRHAAPEPEIASHAQRRSLKDLGRAALNLILGNNRRTRTARPETPASTTLADGRRTGPAVHATEPQTVPPATEAPQAQTTHSPAPDSLRIPTFVILGQHREPEASVPAPPQTADATYPAGIPVVTREHSMAEVGRYEVMAVLGLTGVSNFELATRHADRVAQLAAQLGVLSRNGSMSAAHALATVRSVAEQAGIPLNN